jgi:hypothetical protein
MEAKRVQVFDKYGCHFEGKLVVVDYTQEVRDRGTTVWNWGQGIPEAEQAEKLVRDQYTIKEVLLNIPEFVCIVE